MLRVVLALTALCLLCGAAAFSYYYVKYERIIDKRMSGQIFSTSAKIFARPFTVHRGVALTPGRIAVMLRKAGYSDASEGAPAQVGSYRRIPGGIEVMPGPESYHSRDGARILSGPDGRVSQIVGIGRRSETPLEAYDLEPELVTTMFQGEERTKRELLTYKMIPPVMLQAVLAIEDRKFFEHSGINWWSMMGALVTDLRGQRARRGGSTITMQLSRGFFLSPEKKIRRKLTEMLIAVELERKFSKEKIFELYANKVYLGQRGSYSITGFGEAARAYFGKNIRDITLPEAALIAGIIQSPNWLNPYKRPDLVLKRRSVVLESMVETGAITRKQCNEAKAAPLKLNPPNVEASDAPYFVDMVKSRLADDYSGAQLNENAYRIYTTLDTELQRAAAEAVAEGMVMVDQKVAQQRTRRKRVGRGKSAKVEETVESGPIPQVALVALDPHTGEVLAMVGGRNYGQSQLNHAVAKRPTGSIFKPFVYAAAINSSITALHDEPVYTQVTLIDDSPTTFEFNGEEYDPHNYKNEYHGQVTARYALQKSLNNATVRMAEMVGYDKVAALARNAGISSVLATPAAALGAYDASPLQMAGAYTVLANSGTRSDPQLLRSIREPNGDVVKNFDIRSRQVLDPRAAYVVTNMMENVIDHGTGFVVRQLGFTAPAAGKTGTSHDGWFAGYTSNLLCIVWVGFDDYSDLKLAGSATAGPIWANFMKRAAQLPQYEDAGEFVAPEGVVTVVLDKSTNLMATASCPDDYSSAFVEGTEPKETCENGSQRNVFQTLFGNPPPQLPAVNQPGQVIRPDATRPRRVVVQAEPETAPRPASPAKTQEDKKKKKRGFWGTVTGIFDDGSGQ